MKTITTFKGRDINDMSREELIQTIIELGDIYAKSLEYSETINKTWAAIARH